MSDKITKVGKRFSFGGEPLDFDAVALSVGPGWKSILDELTNKLFRLGWDGKLSQVKEKFGGLRFYWINNIQDPTLAAIADDVVEVAESRSTQTCEQCGKYGRSSDDGVYWIKTLCKQHSEERKAEALAARTSRDKAAGGDIKSE